ncbi:hypothetical protein CHLRE_12g538550v5 [Chlamydomonas reinhardtii]|uniref:GATA-type domain-containing protein n=1 Tax=Chlamydomonas reinhardtii TaxID=3055 RepID=A0A2K3D5C6_CHLRE|nr:uncharacterized protein CHLRE_12g538550v5 [Chlamydomonas reinhardtii]PNW75727.1 hypothetical protein CHLRE_12g538550v5 [Chlamydomonas reinhardtii]
MGALEALAAVCAEELQSNQRLALVDSTGVHSAVTGGGYLQNYQHLVQVLAAHAAKQQQQTAVGPGGLRLQLPLQVQTQLQHQPQQQRAPVILHQQGRPTQPVIVTRPPTLPVPAALPPAVTFRPQTQQLQLKRPADSAMSEARGKLESVDVRPLSPPSKPSSKPLIPGGPCENPYCGVVEAPQWRRIEKKLVCNRCGMYYHRHARFPDWSYFSGLANKNSTRHVVITHRGREGLQQNQPQQTQSQQVQILSKPPLPAHMQQTPSPLASPSLSPALSPNLLHVRDPAPVPQTLAQAAGPEVEQHEQAAAPGGMSDGNLSELLRQAGASADLEAVQRLLTTPVRQLDIDTIRKLQALLGERVRQQQHTQNRSPPMSPSREAMAAKPGQQEPPASPQRGASPGSPRSDSTFAPPAHALDGAPAVASGRGGAGGSAVAEARQVPSGPARSPLRTPPSSLLQADSVTMMQLGQQPATGSALSPGGSSLHGAANRAGADAWEACRTAAAEQRSPRVFTDAEVESVSAGPEMHPVKRMRVTPPPAADTWAVEPARRVQVTSQAGLQQQVLLTHMLLQQQQQEQDKALRAAAMQQQQQRQAAAARQLAAAQRQAAVEEAGMLMAQQQQQQQQQRRRAQMAAQSATPAGAGAAGRSLMETIAAAAALQQQQHGPSRGGQQEQQWQEHQQQQQQERGLQGAMGGLLMRDLQQRAMLVHHHYHQQQQQHQHQQAQHHQQQQQQQGGGQRRLSGSGYSAAPQLRLVALDGSTAAAAAARGGPARGGYDGGYLQQQQQQQQREQGRRSSQQGYFAGGNNGGMSQAVAGRGAGLSEAQAKELLSALLARRAGGGGGNNADFEAAALAALAAAKGAGQMGGGGNNPGGVAALLPVLDLGKPSAAVAF